MAIDVTAHTTIASERERVASYAMDPRNDPTWISGISEVELLDELPLEKGSKVRRLASFLGKRIDYVLEVAELEPNSRLLMRSVKSPFPMVVTYSFDDAPGGTRMGVRVEGEPGSLYRAAGPLMARMVKRSISKDLRTLKAIIESGPSMS
ncbi:MAG TPA: SRPBCC family protein [Actinomycetota bacterium]|jgi:uncharacterized membrane protein